jgi:hypothetical protein
VLHLQIISGGQTGADRAALDTARSLGIPTGGWAPLGWATEEGRDESLRDYGLQECPTDGYPARTFLNVRDADVTVWFGTSDSRGMQCTERATVAYAKPFLRNPTAPELAAYIRDHNVRVLNVAGSRATRNHAIAAHVFTVLTTTVHMLRKDRS